jgi:hypothetical protein
MVCVDVALGNLYLFHYERIMIVYNNTSDIRDSISPVCMREISVDEAVTIDKDVQLLRVMDGHNDADITLHIAQ